MSQIGKTALVDVLQAWLLGQGAAPYYIDTTPGIRSASSCMPSSMQVGLPTSKIWPACSRAHRAACQLSAAC